MSFHLEGRDSIAVLTFDRPPVNAFDLDSMLALEAAARDLAAAPPQALVVTGAGRAFSAGVDTRAFAAATPTERADLVRAITRTVATLYGLPIPVVTAAGGHAMGGGFVMLLLGDMRLAADDPALRFGLQEARAGVPFPAGPLEVIRAELSPELLRWLTLTSVDVDAVTLQARGVLDRLVPGEQLLDEAVGAARALAAQPAFGVVKQQVRGQTARRLAALAASAEDPLVDLLLASA